MSDAAIYDLWKEATTYHHLSPLPFQRQINNYLTLRCHKKPSANNYNINRQTIRVLKKNSTNSPQRHSSVLARGLYFYYLNSMLRILLLACLRFSLLHNSIFLSLLGKTENRQNEIKKEMKWNANNTPPLHFR